MSRDENFRKVIDEAYKGDDFGQRCEHLVHGIMGFLTELLGADKGTLRSNIQEDHVMVVNGDKGWEFKRTRQYRGHVVVKGPNGEEWVLQVAITPPEVK
jgi:hypothetical protein